MKPAKTSAMPTLRHQLSSPVSAQSLALFRIAFGALMLWDCWRFIKYERVWRYWIQPDFHFSYPGFSWVEPLPQPWLQIAWLGVGLAAALVMLGVFYRGAIIALTENSNVVASPEVDVGFSRPSHWLRTRTRPALMSRFWS